MLLLKKRVIKFLNWQPAFAKSSASFQPSVLWLTHICKLLVGDLQPGHVFLVQVVAAHPLCQSPDVYVAQCLGPRCPDQLLWPDEHDLLPFLCQHSAQSGDISVYCTAVSNFIHVFSIHSVPESKYVENFSLLHVGLLLNFLTLSHARDIFCAMTVNEQISQNQNKVVVLFSSHQSVLLKSLTMEHFKNVTSYSTVQTYWLTCLNRSKSFPLVD